MVIRRRIGLAALASLAAAVAMGAVAAAELSSDRDRTTISGGERGVAVAKCDRGEEAVSGGFDAPGFDDGASAIYTYVSKRGGARKIKASGSQEGLVESDLVAHAVCDTKNRGLTTRTASAPVEFGEDRAVTARCPRGSEAVWGGFANPGVAEDVLPVLTVGSSRKGKRKWTVSGVSFAGGLEDPTLKAYAYCDEDEPGLDVRTKPARLAENESGTATAKCKQGTEAVSGGYFSPGGFDTGGGPEIYFRESHKVGKRKWRAAGDNSGDPARLVAFAYCK